MNISWLVQIDKHFWNIMLMNLNLVSLEFCATKNKLRSTPRFNCLLNIFLGIFYNTTCEKGKYIQF